MHGEQVELSDVERVLALKKFRGFGELSPEHLSVLARHARPIRFATGKRLFHAGHRVRDFHLVLEGSIAVHRDERLLASFGPGEIVGGYAGFSEDPRGMHAVAQEPSFTLCIARPEMEELIEENFDLLLTVARHLALDVIDARKKLGAHAGFEPLPISKPEARRAPLNLVDRIDLLRSTRNLSEARIDMLARLAEDASEVRLRARERLWRIGDDSTHLLVIDSGFVRCEAKADDSDFHFYRGPSHAVGAADVLADVPRWHSAVAETDVVGLDIEGARLLDILEDNVEMAFEAMRGLAATALRLHERLASSSPHATEAGAAPPPAPRDRA